MSQKLEIKIRDLVGASLMTLVGAFDGVASPSVDGCFRRIINGSPRVVVDLEAVDYISSAGLRVLLAAQRDARAAGGDIRLVGVERSVKEIFAISGFDTAFDIFDRLEAALTGFGIDAALDRRGTAAVVTLRGSLDPAVSAYLAPFLRTAREGASHLVLEVSAVVYLSPDVIRTLRAAADEVRRGGGRAVLLKVQPAVLESLEVTGAVAAFEQGDALEKLLEDL